MHISKAYAAHARGGCTIFGPEPTARCNHSAEENPQHLPSSIQHPLIYQTHIAIRTQLHTHFPSILRLAQVSPDTHKTINILLVHILNIHILPPHTSHHLPIMSRRAGPHSSQSPGLIVFVPSPASLSPDHIFCPGLGMLVVGI
jgi:hypothetical protein